MARTTPRHDIERGLAVRVGHERQAVVRHRVRPHAARVRAPVSLERALVVLHERHRGQVRAVDEGLERELLALEPLLDHDRPADLADVGAGSRAVDLFARDPDALASGQADRLDRELARVVADEPDGLVGVGEEAVLGAAGNPVPREQGPGPGLVGLDPRRRPRRAERGDAGAGESVGEPGLERRLGADHGEVHAGLDREPDHARHVGLGREQEGVGERGDPRVPRGHDGRQARCLVPNERGRDRVLPSSATHHQVLHRHVYQDLRRSQNKRLPVFIRQGSSRARTSGTSRAPAAASRSSAPPSRSTTVTTHSTSAPAFRSSSMP